MTKMAKSDVKKQTILFLHIPKAAGSTLHTVFNRQYKLANVFTIDEERSIEDLKQLSIQQRSEIEVLKGHMYFGLHELLPQPSTYITILRDPVERVISHYYYILRNPSNELYNQVAAAGMNLKDFVLSGLSLEIDNGQTRLLSSFGAVVPYKHCSPEILESAKQNVKDHFSIIGFVERFDETLILLKRALKWKMPFYTKSNITQNRPFKAEIPKDTLDVIEAYNQLDIQLYQFAQEIFKEQIRQHGFSFKKDLNTLRLANGIYQSYSKAYTFSRSAIYKHYSSPR